MNNSGFAAETEKRYEQLNAAEISSVPEHEYELMSRDVQKRNGGEESDYYNSVKICTKPTKANHQDTVSVSSVSIQNSPKPKSKIVKFCQEHVKDIGYLLLAVICFFAGIGLSTVAGISKYNCGPECNREDGSDSCPCLHGGVCSNSSYYCSCPPGYIGTNCQIDTCPFYITEYFSNYISKVDDFGNVTRIIASGDLNPTGIVRDGNTLFYLTIFPCNVWSFDVTNPTATHRMMWQEVHCYTCNGLGITTTDNRLFVHCGNQRVIYMLDYSGQVTDILNITNTPAGDSYGLVTDEARRILYFSDYSYSIYSVTYTISGFTGPALVILSGTTQVGDGVTGMVIDSTGNTLYWIIRDWMEIRSFTIGSNKSQVVVAGEYCRPSSSPQTYGLAMCNENFYYTNSSGGVWVAASSEASKVRFSYSSYAQYTWGITNG